MKQLHFVALFCNNNIIFFPLMSNCAVDVRIRLGMLINNKTINILRSLDGFIDTLSSINSAIAL